MDLEKQTHETRETREKAKKEMNRNIRSILNPPTLWMGASVAFSGTAAAALHHSVNFVIASLCLIFCVLIQVCGNAGHIYAEVKNGTNHIPDATMHSDFYKNVTITFGILSGMAGLTIISFVGWWLMIFGVATVICIYLNYLIKKPLAHSTWGLLMTFLLFGPIGVIGTCYSQFPYAIYSFGNSTYMYPCIYFAILMGLYAMSYQIMYFYTNWRNDVLKSHKTPATIMGPRATSYLYLATGILATLVLVAMIFSPITTKSYVMIGLWILAAINLVYRIYIFIRMHKSQHTVFGDIRCDIMVAFTTFSIMILSILEAYMR